jgi:putative hydrolase of the HAD superfamily
VIRIPATIRAVSFDFANTLYPLRSGELEQTIESLHAFLESAVGYPVDYDDLRGVYLAVRERQFTENRPTLRENDFTERIAHTVSAALGGAPPPPDLVAAAEDAYSQGFQRTMTMPYGLCDTIAAISERFKGRVAVCSNFIRADAIRGPLERDGIMPFLKGVVVSCEVGFIKPHPAVFRELLRTLDVPADQIVHVGDDWDADVLGATRCGMSAIYTTEWRDEIDSPYGTEARTIAEIERLADILEM